MRPISTGLKASMAQSVAFNLRKIYSLGHGSRLLHILSLDAAY